MPITTGYQVGLGRTTLPVGAAAECIRTGASLFLRTLDLGTSISWLNAIRGTPGRVAVRRPTRVSVDGAPHHGAGPGFRTCREPAMREVRACESTCRRGCAP